MFLIILSKEIQKMRKLKYFVIMKAFLKDINRYILIVIIAEYLVLIQIQMIIYKIVFYIGKITYIQTIIKPENNQKENIEELEILNYIERNLIDYFNSWILTKICINLKTYFIIIYDKVNENNYILLREIELNKEFIKKMNKELFKRI